MSRDGSWSCWSPPVPAEDVGWRKEGCSRSCCWPTPIDGVFGRFRVSTKGVFGRMGTTSFVWALRNTIFSFICVISKFLDLCQTCKDRPWASCSGIVPLPRVVSVDWRGAASPEDLSRRRGQSWNRRLPFSICFSWASLLHLAGPWSTLPDPKGSLSKPKRGKKCNQ